jgi:hypothetical protein
MPDELNHFAPLMRNVRAPFAQSIRAGSEQEALRRRVHLFRIERQFNNRAGQIAR